MGGNVSVRPRSSATVAYFIILIIINIVIIVIISISIFILGKLSLSLSLSLTFTRIDVRKCVLNFETEWSWRRVLEEARLDLERDSLERDIVAAL